ncbi:MAG: ATP synthase F1 subunit delta [Bacteroidales bacterium]|nr:ATP synthase F1 subunit delta [Bacteroidales bacterium]
MNDFRINTHYAKALLLLATERDAVDRVADDMRMVSEVMSENRELAVVLGNPTVKGDKKAAIVDALFGSRVCDTTAAFLRFAVRKNRSVNLRGIGDAYVDMWREYRGVVFSDLVTHQPIDDTARRMVTQMVEDYTGRKVELHDRTDPKMLGGYKLEFDGKMYDARIRTKIRKLRIEFGKNIYESKL